MSVRKGERRDATAFAVDLSDGRRLVARLHGSGAFAEWRVQVAGGGHPAMVGRGFRLSEALADAGAPSPRELLDDALDGLDAALRGDQ